MTIAASCRYVNGTIFFFQAEDGIRDLVRSRGLGDVYKRQDPGDRLEDVGVDPGVVVTGEASPRCRRHGAEYPLSLIHI